jgi:hypothetical protein
MKIALGRIISMLAVFLLASGYYFSATHFASSEFHKHKDGLQLNKLVDTQDELSSVQGEEEEEEDFNSDISDSHYYTDKQTDLIPVQYKSFRHIYKSQRSSYISVPLWLKNRSIII